MTRRPPTHDPPPRRRRPLRRPHRRGAVYLAVLGSSLLVAMIGISAIMTNRAIHRAGETTHRATEARYLAHSAVELALFLINSDPDWRSQHTHGEWSARGELDPGDGRYRLLAAEGSDLENPADGHVHLEVEGRVGDAVRLMRLTLQPANQLPGVNHVRNPEMAEGTRFWRAGLNDDKLEYTLAEAHVGEGSLRVRNLTGSGSVPSIRQDVSSWLESGESYRIRFAVHLLDKERDIHARFIVNGNTVATQTFTGLTTSNWTQQTVTLTPTWSGTIDSAYLEIAAHRHTDFLLDDVSITAADIDHAMVPVPGSWRQTVIE